MVFVTAGNNYHIFINRKIRDSATQLRNNGGINTYGRDDLWIVHHIVKDGVIQVLRVLQSAYVLNAALEAVSVIHSYGHRDNLLQQARRRIIFERTNVNGNNIVVAIKIALSPRSDRLGRVNAV